MMTRMKLLDSAKERLIYGFFETYLKLSGEEKVKKVALEMLKEGLNEELIVKVTHLDLEEIKKLKEQLCIKTVLV